MQILASWSLLFRLRCTKIVKLALFPLSFHCLLLCQSSFPLRLCLSLLLNPNPQSLKKLHRHFTVHKLPKPHHFISLLIEIQYQTIFLNPLHTDQPQSSFADIHGRGISPSGAKGGIKARNRSDSETMATTMGRKGRNSRSQPPSWKEEGNEKGERRTLL